MRLRYLLPLLLISNAHAAPWERPAGAYTPTNHSVNITKYQQISAAKGGIPSADIDGDMNKAFQGLNDLDSRTPPSVLGNSGKFLTNDGSATSWGLISPSAISSGVAAAGLVLQATGTGLSGYGTISASALPASGVTSGTYPFASIQVDTTGRIVSASGIATPTMAGLTVNGVVTATTVTATSVSAQAISTTSINGFTYGPARVVFNGIPSPSSVLRAENVSSVTNLSTGRYQLNGTFPTNGVVNCIASNTAGSTAGVMTIGSPTTAAINIYVYNTASGAAQNLNNIACAVQ